MLDDAGTIKNFKKAREINFRNVDFSRFSDVKFSTF